MNTFDFRIIGLYTKIKKNRKLSRTLKILAGSCCFFAFFYCFGTRTIENMGYMDNAQKVLGIELAAAAQGVWLRQEMGEKGIDQMAPATKAAYDYIRTISAPIEEDVIMHDELVKFDEMIKDGSLLEAVEKVVTLK